MPGRVIVVGGHSRGVGKTALVAALVRTLRARGRAVVTVKVSAHRHGAASVVEEDRVSSPWTSTGRCLAAGAARAFLCRCPDEHLAAAATLVHELRASGADVVVESNRMAARLDPDLTLFVVSAGTSDWKPSSAACLARADAIVLSRGTDVAPLRVWPYLEPEGRAARLAFSAGWRVSGLERWLARRQRWTRRSTKNTLSHTAKSPASPNDNTEVACICGTQAASSRRAPAVLAARSPDPVTASHGRSAAARRRRG
jgi:Ni2+-binding GTPase involved in maturation of urease and hydrogenase